MTDELSNGLVAPLFQVRVPNDDDRLRRICAHCGFVDYVNPKIVVGSVILHHEKFVLCKRAIEPRKGFWTLPAGFMEDGESVEQAAQREAMEEANAKIRIDRMLSIYSVPRISQVHIMFRAFLESDISAGPESQAVGLFEWKDIPWSELAFPTIVWALSHYSVTRRSENFAPFANPAGTEAITR